MRTRVRFGLGLLKLGRFVQSLAVCVMKPADLVEFSRRSYAEPESVDYWTRKERVDSGLSALEQNAMAQIPVKKGRLLLLGLGGGKEAIALAQMGYEVTGVDFIPDMVARTEAYAREKGVKIVTQVGEFSSLEVPEASFDIIWLSTGMYSAIPTRSRRIVFLKKMALVLKTGGYMICLYSFNPRTGPSRKGEFFRQAFALLSLGNIRYQRGDRLHFQKEFLHDFYSEDELRSEFVAGGFEALEIMTEAAGQFPLATLRKK